MASMTATTPTAPSGKEPLIEVRNIKKRFKKESQQELLVLNNINFTVREGEVVALLGRSGSGKSTLLRVIAGLIKPNGGEVLFRGEPVLEPVQGIAMVFQHFALMPWLTVLQNVELGLEALGIPRRERRIRALKAIDMIGLDGFESAFPKELSGGMRQRVGIARALVVQPDVLLMDEPFSALDVLTAENLRNDLIDLWRSDAYRKNSILLVTHNIEEAVLMADRAVVLDHTPSIVRGILKIPLPYPRNTQSPEFRQIVDEVYSMITTSMEETDEAGVIDFGYRFPTVGVSGLAGLLETIDELERAGQTVSLVSLAEKLSLGVDDLLSLTQVLDILHLVHEADGKVHLTPAGKQFADADILQRKKIFARHLLAYVPLIKHIYRTLDHADNHRLSKRHFLDDLEPYLSNNDAKRVLQAVTEWGRYAELFAYDDKTEELNLENPE